MMRKVKVKNGKVVALRFAGLICAAAVALLAAAVAPALGQGQPNQQPLDTRTSPATGVASFVKAGDCVNHPLGCGGSQDLNTNDIPDDCEAPSIIHVDEMATGANDGTSWGDAYTDLQNALATAVAGDQVWVATGTYKPTTGTDRTATFALISGVSILGGYAGHGAGDPDERNIELYETILSGDLAGDDDPPASGGSSTCCTSHGTPGCDDATCQADVCAEISHCCSMDWDIMCVREAASLCCDLCAENTNTCENSYHVVTADGTDATAVLDGFTVTGGNADAAAYSHSYGGGMYNESGSPTVTNCTFSGNSAATHGGGMYNYNNSIPTVINCVFTGNTSPHGGGMYNYYESSPTVANCTFSGNSADSGGGMWNSE
ncbi:MAG: right-handed parallel beta-helix repeat-containing protein, partial [Phycisphaerales bacterium]